MPYATNRNYNTRTSGRYNTAGQFVSAGELGAGGASAPQGNNTTLTGGDPPMQQRTPRHSLNNQAQQYEKLYSPAQGQSQNQHISTQDVEMKQEVQSMDAVSTGGDSNADGRPAWMKNKLLGVKKLSNKERRRRQNENLRRLLTPKNALMVLNEMLPGEQLANQFKVEPSASAYYGPQSGPNFRADLTLEGNTYKGYGENKLIARNAAAEQAIRDIIIKRMSKLLGGGGGGAAGAAAAAAAAVAGDFGSTNESQNGDPDDESLPMIQLASFALHKLFSEWEYEGHKVPQLKQPNVSVSETSAVDGGGPSSTRTRGPPKPKKKDLPVNASKMHPCMLLTYMRPGLEYRELSVDGEKPQNMMFTVGVDVDGATYIGKAANKKEARKFAAKSACQALFNVEFEPVPTANAPQTTL